VIVVNITTPRQLAVLLATATTLSLSACSTSGDSTPVPSPTATSTQSPQDEKSTSAETEFTEKDVAETIEQLKKQGFPVIDGQLSEGFEWMEATFQFEGCAEETLTVVPGNPAAVQGVEFSTHTEPPENPTEDWSFCGTTMGKAYGDRLRDQGFDVVENPRLQGTAGGTWTTIRLRGCDKELEMLMLYTKPLELDPQTLSIGAEPFSKPPTDPEVIKEMCVNKSGLG
jgi:hypothetical protein